MTAFIAKGEHEVNIPLNDALLPGIVMMPDGAQGLVIFAHGSGSSRLSSRNQYVARELQQAKMGTLLFDLLTEEEDEIDEQTMQFRFDIPFLAARLSGVTDWICSQAIFEGFPLGYFGASTGAASALVAAAKHQTIITAVVSRGGRPDLANAALTEVKAATLLIVGGLDDSVIELNKQALAQLNCIKKLEIVPAASHLFEEPGKLAEVAKLASDWFKKYLR